ncbi:uncharacterized protein SCHCODRAFT_01088480 [Schizophyllum commune H4-8]|uniref:uncharacterized protein n=1 Tax=Schizophyllum commune (strain H4-8 / FGSC 9210) TaxID=578458 RepID=UPI00215E1B5A|nr:uncharacterized protein SCHCODRAFT_01088480 [Schizophyllum commune H4-8]KAI5895259.1 hypothetical protein SCHCODRAFT_01088480 [Schizophyllum commune H4-8]
MVADRRNEDPLRCTSAGIRIDAPRMPPPHAAPCFLRNLWGIEFSWGNQKCTCLRLAAGEEQTRTRAGTVATIAETIEELEEEEATMGTSVDEVEVVEVAAEISPFEDRAVGGGAPARHRRPVLTGHPAKRPGVAESDVPQGEVEEVEFFTMEGLSIGNGMQRSADLNMKPSEVHNHLKVFLQRQQSLALDSAYRVESFVKIFGSVNKRNPHWNTDYAQRFLDTVVNGDALLLVAQVLQWDSVSCAATTSGRNLSFQKGYFPLIEFFACDMVYKTTMSQNVNKLFTVVKNGYEKIHDTLSTNVEAMITARSWAGVAGSQQSPLDGILVFEVLTTFYTEFFARFKSAVRDYPQILTFVENLASWFIVWRDGVNTRTFADPIASSPQDIRGPTLAHIGKDVERLLSVVQREFGVAEKQRRSGRTGGISHVQRQDALVAQLTQSYDAPGALREEGIRHDNDSAVIQEIRIAPTHQELMCPVDPYLPYFVANAPHHLPANSMQKHLDIQFRLLREEMISTVRRSVNVVMDDLHEMRTSALRRGQQQRTTQLANLLRTGGGSYRSSGHDSVFFHLYSGAEFSPAKAERQKLTVGLRVDAPPGAARDEHPQKRFEYWEHSRRLSSGNLIALVLSSNDENRIFLGTLQSNGEEIGESARANAGRIEVRVSFFDAEIELYALRNEAISNVQQGKYAFLVDNSVLFESARPFLETLQAAEPTAIPFADYIAREGSLQGVPMPPPRYTRAPGFRFDLSCLMNPGANIDRLDTQNAASIARVRQQLIDGSYLDHSQAQSVVDTLTREISLIQGFTGKELLRVLFKNKIKPIVLIAYTNHALDHMLRSVLDAGITTNIVRLGSRSTDELVSQYNLNELERVAGRTSLHRTLQREYAIMKEAQEKMDNVMDTIQVPFVHWSKVKEYLDLHEPELARKFDDDTPFWIQQLHRYQLQEEEENGEWTEGVADSEADVEDVDESSFPDAAQPPPGAVPDPRLSFFLSLGFSSVPPMPANNPRARSIEQLQATENPWNLNLRDRTRLAKHWEEEVRQMAYAANLDEFEQRRIQYLEACQNYDNVKNEVELTIRPYTLHSLTHMQSRRELLRRTELIGCTTTGAAKLVSLLNAISPKVLMVEEAGQVLEAHILASLVPSVQHLIEIGDPQQLRPTLATYGLSMDHSVGGRIYKFDRSLMERLADNGAPMSLINVQRRMRTNIADYPRLILYPTLSDHPLVEQYPDVQGMRQNVFFFTHTHQENGEKDSVSKFNMFEVEIIRDLVIYFLKQGPYTGKGDIAVLCAYLGQLQKVRAALKDAKLAVSLDERDQEQLERQGGEELEPGESFENVQVAKHIRLGTVDTFQGEEAKIVIVSLVRNSGDFAGDSPIGFLKVVNRINVALSRAKHGQYILGNAANLRHNATWSKILDEMEAKGQVGTALPIVCPRHPDTTREIDGPNQLPLEAPEGGCLARCDYQLKCGHTCQSVCHPDLEMHGRMKCTMPCPRIKCPRQHPCPRECGQPCGDCEFPMYNVQLPCGHVAARVKCHDMENLASVKCRVKVTKQLPLCEHSTMVECYRDPAKVNCKACRQLTAPRASTRVERTNHQSHPCERKLYCQHLYMLAPALRRTVHDAVVHHANALGKVCGEACDEQACIECFTEDQRAQIVVDLIMGETAADLDLDASGMNSRIITLACGHIFTVETLDGHCGMSSFYEVEYASDGTISRYADVKAPPVDYQNPPSCPTCRGPITARRYGRVVKRAHLDILERNVASSMSKALGAATHDIGSLDTRMSDLEGAAKTLKSAPASKAGEELDTALTTWRAAQDNTKEDEPMPANLFDVMVARGFGSEEAKAWRKVVKPLFDAYKKIAKVAGTKGPHVRTYQAALATLYRLEHDAIIRAGVSSTPEPDAMRIVDKKIGQPPHKADTRFQVDAFMYSVEIRLRVAQVGRARYDALGNASGSDEQKAVHRQLWFTFLEVVYASCSADTAKALEMANRSCASRQAARCALLGIRVDMEKYRFCVFVRRETLLRSDRYHGEQRSKFVQDIRDQEAKARRQLSVEESKYVAARPCRTASERQAERKWYQDNCTAKANKYIEEYEKLAEHIQSDTAYTPLSTSEMQDIVRSMGFGYRGHFYNCQNGHTFVIGECGGAMETARCPECDCPIGGSNHQLHSSNTRAMEYENLAREQGGLDPHWDWGRGA